MLIRGDMLDVLPTIDADSITACVCDPPYELGFMGKGWDRSGIANRVETWHKVYRVLKPGAYLVAFGGTRTFHRLTCAIEDAGFEIRDCLMWLYGSGFPKSLDVSKAIDKAAGATRLDVGERVYAGGHIQRSHGTDLGSMNDDGWNPTERRLTTAPSTDAAKQWSGWGTALKPAWEPIILARKPLIGTVASNVLAHGTGALNIDGARIAGEAWTRNTPYKDDIRCGALHSGKEQKTYQVGPQAGSDLGRWPANVVLDWDAAKLLDDQSGELTWPGGPAKTGSTSAWPGGEYQGTIYPGETGGASRFLYVAKPSREERDMGDAKNSHPTVKPIALMRWLVKLVTPTGGVVLDPFMGSGTTGVACKSLQVEFVGIEQEPDYLSIAERRIDSVAPLFDVARSTPEDTDLNGLLFEAEEC
jgi:site-specific DNA-methyltransferase (adenine-specific)